MKYRVIIIGCLLMCGFLIVTGQEKIRYLTIDEGLSNNTTTCVSRDKHGFMWFGTYDGLNRYDGYVFKKYNRKIGDTTSMPDNLVRAIAEDDEGRHWIAATTGISVLDHKTSAFTRVNFFPYGNGSKHSSRAKLLENTVNCIADDKDGNILAGTDQAGVIIFQKGQLTGTQVGLSYNGKIIFNYSVTALLITAKQSWICIENIGLCLYDRQSGFIKVKRPDNIKINCLIEGQKDTILVGADNGLYQFNVNSWELSQYRLQNGGLFSPGRVMSLCMESSGRLWIATDGNGVAIIDSKTRQSLPLSQITGNQHISSNAIYCVYKDDLERIWIGTFRGGINMIDRGGNPFYSMRLEGDKNNSQAGNFIFSFCEDNSGQVWIGTDGNGISVWNRKTNIFKTYTYTSGKTGLTSNNISAMIADDDGDVWIGSYGGGIVKFDIRSKMFLKFPEDSSCKYVWRLYKDRSGDIWAGCSEGLYKYDKNTGQFTPVNKFTAGIMALTEDHLGRLWIGTGNSLKCIDKKGNSLVTITADNRILTIIEDKTGTIWAGTQGDGLIKYAGGKHRFYTEQQGLPNNNVLNLLEDSGGAVWMSTYNGLSKLTPSKESFENFFDVDGLQSNQFYYNAAIRLKSGELMFGGIKGFTLFRPELCIPKKSFPPLTITGIRILNEEENNVGKYVKGSSLYAPDKIEVPYSKAVLSIDFAALEYSLPRKIQYAYILEGWDKTWIMAGSLKTANYSELREGNYILRVKSTNVSGIWNTNELRLPIYVSPPWYRSWWAYGLYLLLVGGAIIVYQRYRLYRTKLKYEIVLANLNAEKQTAEYHRKEAELKTERAEGEKKEAELAMERSEREFKEAELAREHAERETERVLNEKEKEINEKKLSFFTHVSHEFRTPLSLIINPIKDILQKNKEDEAAPDGELPVIYRNARRLMSMVDQLLLFRKAESGLDLIKPSRLSLCSFCKEVYLCFVQQAKAKDIAYLFECNATQLELYADPQKLEIILYNLLSNALKYTPYGGSILLHVREGEQDVEIVVEDTGPGIPRQVGDRLFDKYYQPDRKDASAKAGFGIGLYLVKQFTEQHKGTITYLSEEGKGTTFTLRLLKGKEHFGSDATIGEEVAESFLLQQLKEEMEVEEMTAFEQEGRPIEEVVTDKQTILLIDDDEQTLQYLVQQFKEQYIVYQADRGEEGIQLARQYLPDLIISDVHMHGMSGIELCKAIKEDTALGHIPVILLTASSSDEIKLEGVEGGADDYITKPFDNKLLIARVASLLKGRNNLQKYFYNEITHNKSDLKISAEYKEFLEQCISIVERHLEDDDFGVKSLMSEIGMSHSNLFRKVKSVSGQSINVFIRCIRLRKAAELFINTGYNVNETAYMVGFQHQKYFRHQFHKLFGLNPSDYIKKYRKAYGKQYTVQKDSLDPENLNNK